jgi:putative ABC transport system permease protein
MFQDLRYGVRMLLKSPVFTAVAVATLALGIGANTAIFSVVYAVLFRPLPFEKPEQLVVVWETVLARGNVEGTPSPPDFREWRGRAKSFRQMTAFYDTNFNLSGAAAPERLSGAVVSADLFAMLGVNAALGRTFLTTEEQYGAHRVVVLSHTLWRRRFGGDARLVGQNITLDDQQYTVVGVAPPGFNFADFVGGGADVEMWTPMAFAPGDRQNTRGNHFLRVLARLKPGLTIAQAQAEMDAVTVQLGQEHQENAGLGARVVPLRDELVGGYRTGLLVLLGAVGLVLLIACANVANLLLARAAARRREFAIRSALGASRLRVARQLLTESLLLGAAGGAVGMLLAWWGVKLLLALGPADLPRAAEISVDGSALAFTLLLSAGTGVVFGLLPALYTFKFDLSGAFKEGGRSATTGRQAGVLRRALVVTEVAMSLVLLIGAGLLAGSFWRLLRVDPGFNPEKLLTVQITLPETRYPRSSPHQSQAFYRQLVERLESLPGVRSAGATTSLPLAAGGWGKMLSIEGRPAPTSMEAVPVVQYRQVTSSYFATLGVPLLRGRFITERDAGDSPPVAIINEEMARRFFPGEDPVGKRMWMGPPENLLPPGALPPGYSFPVLTVVGVVKDVRHLGLSQQAGPEVYIPHLQGSRETARGMFVALRTENDPLSYAAPVRRTVEEIDKDQPLADLRTMEQRLAESLSSARFNMLLLSVFAGVALLLAAVGLYGVIAYMVEQRTHEIGIRIALGAQRRDVLRLIVGQGMQLAFGGIGIGLAAALGLTRLMSSLLYGVEATNPETFAAVALLLVVVALLASYLPARRAIKINPMAALRVD